MYQKLQFVDGTQVQILGCYGAPEYFRDSMRDTLEYRIDPSVLSFDEAEQLFTAENCDVIQLLDVYDNDATHIAHTHEGYTERVYLKLSEEKVLVADNEFVNKNLLVCKMAKKSEAEILAEAYEILVGNEE